MPTIADSITETKRLLNSNTRSELDLIEVEINDTVTQFKLTHNADGIRAGSYISVSNGNTAPETMYVTKRNQFDVYVLRGMDGSTAQTWAAGSLIEVEPRFTGHQIYQAVKQAIHALPENVYGVNTFTAEIGRASCRERV